MATPIGFEPTISSLTSWHVNRYTTGPPVVTLKGANLLRALLFYSEASKGVNEAIPASPLAQSACIMRFERILTGSTLAETLPAAR